MMWAYFHSLERRSSAPYPAPHPYTYTTDGSESGSELSENSKALYDFEGIEDDDGNYEHILADDNMHTHHLRKESTSLLFTIKDLCVYLRIENILTILAAVLLERSLVFVAGPSDRGVIAKVILSIIPLLRPFEYQSVLMPVCLTTYCYNFVISVTCRLCEVALQCSIVNNGEFIVL